MPLEKSLNHHLSAILNIVLHLFYHKDFKICTAFFFQGKCNLKKKCSCLLSFFQEVNDVLMLNNQKENCCHLIYTYFDVYNPIVHPSACVLTQLGLRSIAYDRPAGGPFHMLSTWPLGSHTLGHYKQSCTMPKGASRPIFGGAIVGQKGNFLL